MIKLEILFEDADILAVAKPSGLIVHSDGRTKEDSVVDWFIKKYPESKEVGEPLHLSDGTEIQKPGIVHRLDRETSGVLLIAKTQVGFEHLKSQFKHRTIKKKYHAIVYGNFKQERGIIDRPIGRSRSDFRRWSASSMARGKIREAVTEYRVIKSVPGASLIEAYPKTGRTHQIRVHFSATQHAVVCDSLYAPKLPAMFGLKRLALHALEVSFTTPSGEECVVIAPYPEDMRTAVEAILG